MTRPTRLLHLIHNRNINEIPQEANMKIAVNTPTGNIGRVVTDQLLDAGVNVVLLARNPDKVKQFVERGATVFEGNLDDADFVVSATKDVDALFWLTPADIAAEDFRGYQRKLGKVVAQAITENKIPRVVNLSSIGAHVPTGTGPIAGLYDVEKKIDKTGVSVTHLRAGFFMENFFMSVESMAGQGAIFLPIQGSARMPMIATADIGRSAADRLLDSSWVGRSVIELIGPDNLSFDGAAKILGNAIGKDIRFMPTSHDQTREAFVGMGVSPSVADGFLEMYGAFDAGTISPESPKKARTATTTLDTFAKNVFRPGFEAMTGSKE